MAGQGLLIKFSPVPKDENKVLLEVFNLPRYLDVQARICNGTKGGMGSAGPTYLDYDTTNDAYYGVFDLPYGSIAPGDVRISIDSIFLTYTGPETRASRPHG
jgi:hypothetical protein